MALIVVYLIVGLALLLVGANYLVDSSVAIAKRANIPNFIIGVTIIGMGTSSPELYISIVSALSGSGDMAVGNVLGSNITNTFLILGLTAAITPFAIERKTLKRDIPFGIIVSGLMVLVISNFSFVGGSSESIINRWEGLLLFAIFGAFLVYSLFFSKGTKEEVEEEVQETFCGKFSLGLQILVVLLSLAVLLYGGDLFLENAKLIAASLGMSESVISITIVAVGTSLPELVTCIIAALKGNPQLALGNVIGSNIFNILMVLGISALVSPIVINEISMVDLSVLVLASLLTFIVAFTFGKRKIDRIEGIIFILMYVGYTTYLLMK